MCAHVCVCVPVVLGQGLRPGELYCTSAQASHWAETPWEQSHGAESSPTSQRWRTQPEGQHEISCTEMSSYLIMWTDFIKSRGLKVCSHTSLTSTTCESLSHLLRTVCIRANTCCKTTTTCKTQINFNNKKIIEYTVVTLYSVLAHGCMSIARMTNGYGWVTRQIFPVGPHPLNQQGGGSSYCCEHHVPHCVSQLPNCSVL